MTMADVPGQYGAKIAQWRRSVAPREALVVLYPAMCAKSHRHIGMVIKIADKPSVLFFIVN